MALIIDVDTDFDSTLPLFVHSPGVSGYTHRFVAGQLTVATGADVTAWPDIGPVPASMTVQDAGATAPNLGVVNGEKYVSFDGVEDGLRSSGYGSAQKTGMLVTRTTRAAGVSSNLAFQGGVVISRGSANDARILLSGGAPSVGTAASTMITGTWEIVMWVGDGNNSFIRAGAAKSPLMTGVATGIATYTGFGREGVSRQMGDVAEHVVWDRALTDAELDTVMNAMIARYGATLGVTA
jgi:hypothetical protein